MEKIVSILSLLEKDKELVCDFDELNQDVEKYKTFNIKSKMEYVTATLQSLRTDIEWYQNMAEASYKYGTEAQVKWLNRAEECRKEKEVAQAELSVLQYKLSLSDDKFVTLEADEIIEQICEVRVEISKQLKIATIFERASSTRLKSE